MPPNLVGKLLEPSVFRNAPWYNTGLLKCLCVAARFGRCTAQSALMTWLSTVSLSGKRIFKRYCGMTMTETRQRMAPLAKSAQPLSLRPVSTITKPTRLVYGKYIRTFPQGHGQVFGGPESCWRSTNSHGEVNAIRTFASSTLSRSRSGTLYLFASIVYMTGVHRRIWFCARDKAHTHGWFVPSHSLIQHCERSEPAFAADELHH